MSQPTPQLQEAQTQNQKTIQNIFSPTMNNPHIFINTSKSNVEGKAPSPSTSTITHLSQPPTTATPPPFQYIGSPMTTSPSPTPTNNMSPHIMTTTPQVSQPVPSAPTTTSSPTNTFPGGNVNVRVVPSVTSPITTSPNTHHMTMHNQRTPLPPQQQGMMAYRAAVASPMSVSPVGTPVMLVQQPNGQFVQYQPIVPANAVTPGSGGVARFAYPVSYQYHPVVAQPDFATIQQQQQPLQVPPQQQRQVQPQSQPQPQPQQQVQPQQQQPQAQQPLAQTPQPQQRRPSSLPRAASKGASSVPTPSSAMSDEAYICTSDEEQETPHSSIQDEIALRFSCTPGTPASAVTPTKSFDDVAGSSSRRKSKAKVQDDQYEQEDVDDEEEDSSKKQRKSKGSSKARTPTDKTRKKRRMTKEEDDILRRAVADCEKAGIDLSWKIINRDYFFNKYDSNFLYQRWNRVLKCTRKQDWTDEDAVELLYYVKQYGGTRWTQIRQYEYDCHFSDTMLANAYKSCLKNPRANNMMKTLSAEEISAIVTERKAAREQWEKPKEFYQLLNPTPSEPTSTKKKIAKLKAVRSTSSEPITQTPKSDDSKSEPEEEQQEDTTESQERGTKRTSAASRFVSSKRRKQEAKPVDTKYSGSNVFDQLVDLFVEQERASITVEPAPSSTTATTEKTEEQERVVEESRNESTESCSVPEVKAEVKVEAV